MCLIDGQFFGQLLKKLKAYILFYGIIFGDPRFRHQTYFCLALLISGGKFIFLLRNPPSRHQGDFLSIFLFADCGIDLDIISNEDIGKLRSGEVYNEECNELAVKMTLELINFCTNMATIRQSAMESALKYLMTNIKHHKLNTSFRKSSTFLSSDNNNKDDHEPSKK